MLLGYVNVILACSTCCPIPPLDGSALVERAPAPGLVARLAQAAAVRHARAAADRAAPARRQLGQVFTPVLRLWTGCCGVTSPLRLAASIWPGAS